MQAVDAKLYTKRMGPPPIVAFGSEVSSATPDRCGIRWPTWWRRRLPAAVSIALVLGTNRPANAQGTPQDTAAAAFVGVVFDAVSGDPVVAAFAAAMGSGQWASTDNNGSFRLDGLRPGSHTFRIWRIGYSPTFFTVSLEPDEANVLGAPIVLNPIPFEMPELVIEGDRTRIVRGPLRDFYRRRNQGIGRFLTRDEIEIRRADRFDQLLRGIPGIQVAYLGAFKHEVRMRGGEQTGCSPDYFVDGLWSDEGTALSLQPEWIEGIELYRRPAEVPPEFNKRGSCGIVVIWTRR